ncbi:photosystem II repair protein PSB27-H1, chloroplastic-like [Tripterygium wilfordii]|uniref:photosystem II repair protein PSB27-H1, chloroplastic-like n=1 Tax=Tripterygium wilfordii TaxID=458696 RepID=UPI0018F843C2|nr:photosystem II repair protein PSB27-H1, chloroplastic-like [Tripterygium wilfordii]
MASPLLTPATKPQTLTIFKTKPTTTTTSAVPTPQQQQQQPLRRQFLSLTAAILTPKWLFPVNPAFASSNDEEYVKETEQVINKVRTTITLDKNDPSVPSAVAELRESSNTWVAKYRREKALLGRASFRDIYSALNAVSGHYVSFGPTAPIPVKRKARILEEVDTAEKALQRGR